MRVHVALGYPYLEHNSLFISKMQQHMPLHDTAAANIKQYHTVLLEHSNHTKVTPATTDPRDHEKRPHGLPRARERPQQSGTSRRRTGSPERPQANGTVLGCCQEISMSADGQNRLLVARDLEMQAEDHHGMSPIPE